MGVFTLPPKGSYTTKSKQQQPTQSCGCKPNSDGRCCTSKSCGCSKNEVGCSPACNCKGFKLVCANATAPVAGPVPKAAKDAGAGNNKKRPAQGDAAPWGGPARKLVSDDPFSLAAAKSTRDTAREAFLARLEAQQRGGGGGGAGPSQSDDNNDDDDEDSADDDVPLGGGSRRDAQRGASGGAAGSSGRGGGGATPARAAAAAGAAAGAGAAAAAGPRQRAAPSPAAAAAAAAAEVVDLCSSEEEQDDDEIKIVSVRGKPTLASAPAPGAPAGGRAWAGAASAGASAPRQKPQQQPRQAAAPAKPPASSSSAAAAPAAAAKPPAGSLPRRDSYDPFQPRQYVPAGGLSALLRGGELRVNESAELRNVDGGWDRGLVACLDTGNEGCTLLSLSAAVRAGLADPVSGEPVGCFGRCESVEVRGVVAGVSERVPLTLATYRVSGKEMRVTVGLTRARLGCDLLVGRKDLLEFERDGYRLSARR